MLSKSSIYAIRSVVFLTVHSSPEQKFSAKDIATKLNAPSPFLAKILQQLARHQLVDSTKGKGGGFFINNPEKPIPIHSIVNCIDGENTLTSCLLGLEKCSADHPCLLHHQFVHFKNAIDVAISKNAISTFVEEAGPIDLQF